jgi:hypothetical protein
MKRVITLALTGLLALTLTACDLNVDCNDNGAGNPAQTHNYCEK